MLYFGREIPCVSVSLCKFNCICISCLVIFILLPTSLRINSCLCVRECLTSSSPTTIPRTHTGTLVHWNVAESTCERFESVIYLWHQRPYFKCTPHHRATAPPNGTVVPRHRHRHRNCQVEKSTKIYADIAHKHIASGER